MPATPTAPVTPGSSPRTLRPGLLSLASTSPPSKASPATVAPPPLPTPKARPCRFSRTTRTRTGTGTRFTGPRAATASSARASPRARRGPGASKSTARFTMRSTAAPGSASTPGRGNGNDGCARARSSPSSGICCTTACAGSTGAPVEPARTKPCCWRPWPTTSKSASSTGPSSK